MRSCRSCDAELYAGVRPYQIDELLCRECQKSPAVQMRVLLERARERDMNFDEAWDFAFARIRWPHDTTHRREWKDIFRSVKSRRVWRSCFERQPPLEREKNLAHLAVAA